MNLQGKIAACLEQAVENREAAGFNLAREALVKYFQHVIRQQ